MGSAHRNPVWAQPSDLGGSAFTPDGTQLASGSEDETIKLYEVDSVDPMTQPDYSAILMPSGMSQLAIALTNDCFSTQTETEPPLQRNSPQPSALL